MIELYFFSGTGNSYYITKLLSARLPGSKVIPIASLLKKKENDKHFTITSQASTIGFIFPCHGLTIPIPVKRFLKIFSFKPSQYLFAVATRGGTIYRGHILINKILKKKKQRLRSSFIITMWMNDPKLKAFQLPTQEELLIIESNTVQHLDLIQKIVLDEEEHHDDIDGITFTKSKIANYIMERMIPFAVHYITPMEKTYFYSTSKCTGCGICAKVCPSNKIIMKDKKLEWQNREDCYFCYGCLNYCPSEAIQIHTKFYMKSYTEEKDRYHHPKITIKEMMLQKSIN